MMRQAGFTVVEMAVTVAIIGVLAATATAAYSRLIDGSQNRLSATAKAATLAEAVIAFAQSRHRLPCPGADASGFEAAGEVCPAAVETGWFPYLAVGLPLPAPAARARYGVYRSAGADLAVARPDNGSLLRSLAAAASEANSPSASHPFITGDLAAGGAENCTANIRSNPAFVVALPEVDRDGDGSGFDGIHRDLAASSRCFAAPTRAADAGFDDRTEAVSFFALMARINHSN